MDFKHLSSVVQTALTGSRQRLFVFRVFYPKPELSSSSYWPMDSGWSNVLIQRCVVWAYRCDESSAWLRTQQSLQLASNLISKSLSCWTHLKHANWKRSQTQEYGYKVSEEDTLSKERKKDSTTSSLSESWIHRLAFNSNSSTAEIKAELGLFLLKGQIQRPTAGICSLEKMESPVT